VVIERDPALLAPFIDAARALEREGVAAVTTSCGFLALFQREMAAAVAVPMWTSSLLLVAEIEAGWRDGRRVGIVTADAARSRPSTCARSARAPTRRAKGWRSTRAFAPRSSRTATSSTSARPSARPSRRRALGRAPSRGRRDRPRVHQHAALRRRVRAATGLPVHDITTLVRARLVATTNRSRDERSRLRAAGSSGSTAAAPSPTSSASVPTAR
jgi:hypothetical protein